MDRRRPRAPRELAGVLLAGPRRHGHRTRTGRGHVPRRRRGGGRVPRAVPAVAGRRRGDHRGGGRRRADLRACAGGGARSGCFWSGWVVTQPGCSPVPSAHLAASKVGSRLVHGRSAAGGTSQQRFARRREKQASEALARGGRHGRAAVFGQFAGKLDAVVLGGDRRAMAGLRDDPRLRPYFELAVERFLTVPDPPAGCAARHAAAVPGGPDPADRVGWRACNRSCRDGPPRWPG